MMTSTARWALVLAGGEGTRLRDLTHEIAGRPMPKQYCRMLGDRSLLQATLSRMQHFAHPARSLVIVNRDHLDLGMPQLDALPATNVVIQPCNRDTGPGIVLALLELARRAPNATVAMLPCDHFVTDDAAFARHVDQAYEVVRCWPEKIALLGIRPDEADTQLGYVSVERRLATTPPTFTASAFTEKPAPAAARRLVREGALWNSFVLVFRVRRMVALLRQEVPQELAEVHRLAARPRALAARYGELEPWNFSRRLLSKIASQLIVIRVEGLHWSDWGTRASIERSLKKLKQPPPWRLSRATAA